MNTSIIRYDNAAIALHWLVALLIFAVFPLGVYMHDLPLSPATLQLYSYHKWMGITVLLLAVLRVVWRFTHTPPALPEGMPRWQKAASHGTHHLLYLLLFAVPLSGWVMSSAKGYQTVWFGVLPLPDLVGKDKVLGELLSGVHQSLNFILLALVVLHLAAVAKHTLIERDDILSRMLPGGKRK
jgi:cytochrome b561